MIEILNIIFLIFSIQWICSISYFSNNLFNYRLSNLEKVSFNLSLLLNIFLIFSFYRLNQQYIFLLFLILPFIDYLFNKNKIFTESTIFLIFFTFVLSISISSNLKLEWDAAELWIYKTINFLFEKSISPRILAISSPFLFKIIVVGIPRNLNKFTKSEFISK